ncbi:MAG: Rrf2 family transcriptional regulator [Gammaproteobacteria bacterium]|nr:Rrf2 family transcriptional regulator [Gammaproteobacteria bacterium]
MQLTHYTDYSLRVLVYLTLKKDKSVTITEIADYYNISRNHLVKIVNNLANLGYIMTTRGKGGGMRLALPADEINVGEVVRNVEPHFDIVECFSDKHANCRIEPICKLKQMLHSATGAFLAELDQFSLQDVISNRNLKKISITSIR